MKVLANENEPAVLGKVVVAGALLTHDALRKFPLPGNSLIHPGEEPCDQTGRDMLEKLQNWYEFMLNSVNEGIYVLDARFNIFFINSVAAKLLCLEDKDFLSKPLFDRVGLALLEDGFQSEGGGRICRAIEEGKGLRIGCESFRRKDGVSVDLEYSVIPITEDGLAVGTVVTFTDVTKRKQAEREAERSYTNLRAANRELDKAHNQLLQSEKMASLGQLAAGVAHEINNPIGYVNSNLTTLQGYIKSIFSLLAVYEEAEKGLMQRQGFRQLQELKQKLDMDYLKKDIFELLRESEEGISRVKGIVQSLKDFSHVAEADWQCCNLHGGLDSTLNIVYNEIKYKAEVVKEYGELPEIECLPLQLNQVFLNLLVNAAHAISERGKITIRTFVKGEDVCVEVEDTGKGIPPENLTRIFDPFFTTKPVGSGTGLGLSLSYSIVQKHNGRIEVESSVGKGSVFRVILPVHQPKGMNS